LSFFAFGFIPGRLMWFLRHLADWSLWRPAGIRLSTEPIAASDVHRITAASRAVVDIEHPRQRGLTMRTIETLLAGHKLVTTNAHVSQSDLYDPTRVCIVDRKRPRIPHAFLDAPAHPVPDAVASRYTLDGFLDELIGTASCAATQAHAT
jgi:hypothetical protein